jgi:predicted RNA-binding Zn ribbon-like protein
MNNKPVNGISVVTKSSENLPFILTLPLTGDRPCLDFLNTIDWRLRPEKYRDALTCYADLLAFVLRINLISITTYSELYKRSIDAPAAAERATNDARTLRDALISIVDDIAFSQKQTQSMQLRSEAIMIFDAARRKAHESESLIWRGDQFFLCPDPEEEELDFPWLSLVRDAEDLFCSPQASRIHICAAEGCGWIFLDLSKNGTRRWCSMKLCGNRVKAARFKAKTND